MALDLNAMQLSGKLLALQALARLRAGDREQTLLLRAAFDGARLEAVGTYRIHNQMEPRIRVRRGV